MRRNSIGTQRVYVNARPLSVEVSMLQILLCIALSLAVAPSLAQPSTLPLESIKLPPGFSIELVARVDNAREMALGALARRRRSS